VTLVIALITNYNEASRQSSSLATRPVTQRATLP
jgi:hypothetical protein